MILIAYENVEDIPFQVGDKVKMTDTCIEDNEYEQYDFSRNTMPKDRKPSFVYSYDDAKRKANMQKVDYLLEQLGLIDRKNFMPDQLSGGQQQRVAIARAMINDPKILFCDEPTGNLDKKTGDEVMDILKMLNEEMGISIMVITHDQSVANRCKKIMHLSDGKLVTSGN